LLIKNGDETEGKIDAISEDVAISSLQDRGFVFLIYKRLGREDC